MPPIISKALVQSTLATALTTATTTKSQRLVRYNTFTSVVGDDDAKAFFTLQKVLKNFLIHRGAKIKINFNFFSFFPQGFKGSNNSNYSQQTSPIPIDQQQHQQQQQQHSPLHNQSYPTNQISAEKMMSYRNANAASPANLSSSQGNLSKVRKL